jgi:hypothetical protein
MAQCFDKLFKAAIQNVCNRVEPFHPSLIFASKDGAYLSEAFSGAPL